MSDVLLLDLDGVLLDNRKWQAEQKRLSSQAFSDLLGGEDLDWASHHPELWQSVWLEGTKTYKEDQGHRRLNLSRWWDRVHAEWIGQLCGVVGVDTPETFEQRVDVAERAKTFVFLNTTAVYERAAGAIQQLAKGYELHMASGNPAWIIETILERLGVRDLVGEPFGCDLIGYQKGHDRFYPAILDSLGASPGSTAVVDDSESHLQRAANHGLRTIRVLEDPTPSSADVSIASISELPDVIDWVFRD